VHVRNANTWKYWLGRSEGWTPKRRGRARAPDSPVPGEDRVSRMRRTLLQEVVAGPLAEQDSGAQRPIGPARRRILLAKVEDGSLEEAVLKAWLRPAISKSEDRALLGLDTK
jgi:hypothetical protein